MYKYSHRVLLVAFGALMVMHNSLVVHAAELDLIVEVGGVKKVSSKGFQAFYEYFGGIWPWILSVAVGIAVLNGIIGGMMVMIAGDNSGMRSEGIAKLEYTTLGLIIIALAGTILRVLNPMFYK